MREDDGEAGAGQLILQMLERAELRDHVVIVTRWYGGKELGGDRFRHVAAAVRHYLAELPRRGLTDGGAGGCRDVLAPRRRSAPARQARRP